MKERIREFKIKLYKRSMEINLIRVERLRLKMLKIINWNIELAEKIEREAKKGVPSNMDILCKHCKVKSLFAYVEMSSTTKHSYWTCPACDKKQKYKEGSLC